MPVGRGTPVFVWIWLPAASAPIVAGRLDHDGSVVTFTYGQSYLARPDAIPLYSPELPLVQGPQRPSPGEVAGCIADAGPDAWGRRVIESRPVRGEPATRDLGILDYLIESGSDRIGALDFQSSPSEYVPRTRGEATLDELAQSAQRVQDGVALSPDLDQALLHGSSVGGARPKALLVDHERRLIAKFSATADSYPVVKAEFVAMELARRAGLEVAPVELTRALGKDVLLIERFDRPAGGGRRAMVSALTILGLDELGARYASYWELADVVRARFTDPRRTLRELFSRITFNILCSNTDDHARNHSAFWDGEALTLTPAYDVCPQPRVGGETAQAMAVAEDGFRMSQLEGCVDRASTYLLTEREAMGIIDHQIAVITDQWSDVCDLAELPTVDRDRLWGRQFLNPYALEGYA